MVLEFEGKTLTTLFSNFVKNSKVMFNFDFRGNAVDVQMLEDYTMCTTLPCKVISTTDNKEIAFWVTNAVHTLVPDYPVTVTIYDGLIEFKQGINSCKFNKEYEAKREFPSYELSELRNLSGDRLKYLVSSSLSCNPMAKELGIPVPDPQFSYGRYYMDYNQAFFIESINFPECSISFASLRAIAYYLNNETDYVYIREKDVILFLTEEYSFWVPVNNYNLEGNRINSINKILNDCTPVTQIVIKDYVRQIDALVAAFPKQFISLSIGDSLFKLSASSGYAQVAVGNLPNNGMLNIEITTSQLSTFSKLFKGEESIEILRGVNCLCMRSGEKNFLVSNLIY